MRRHLTYFRYVLRHKFYVFLACIRLGVPVWLAIIHDWTKFTPREWSPYAHNFFNADGSRRTVRDKTGAYDPNSQSEAFRLAWMSHQRNRHHWQAWISLGDGGSLSPLPIPEKYIREMVADWIGAGMAQTGKDGSREWYAKNQDKMILHTESRRRVEEIIGAP